MTPPKCKKCYTFFFFFFEGFPFLNLFESATWYTFRSFKIKYANLITFGTSLVGDFIMEFHNFIYNLKLVQKFEMISSKNWVKIKDQQESSHNQHEMYQFHLIWPWGLSLFYFEIYRMLTISKIIILYLLLCVETSLGSVR